MNYPQPGCPGPRHHAGAQALRAFDDDLVTWLQRAINEDEPVAASHEGDGHLFGLVAPHTPDIAATARELQRKFGHGGVVGPGRSSVSENDAPGRSASELLSILCTRTRALRVAALDPAVDGADFTVKCAVFGTRGCAR
jgi:hypothetical protein